MAYTRQLCAKRFRRQINDFLHLRCLTYFNREVSCDLFRPSRDLFEINPRIHIPRRNQPSVKLETNISGLQWYRGQHRGFGTGPGQGALVFPACAAQRVVLQR